MCVHSLYEFCYRSYIQRECHSVLARLHPITFYRGMRGSWSECHFVFSLVYQLCLALWSQPNTRMLVTLCICLKQYFDTRYLVFYNTSPPRMFCSWTFFENIGFNTVLRTPLCHILLLNLDILQESFRLCNWLSLRRLVSWINHLPPACWSTFRKSNSKQQLGCRFDIMDYESYFFCVLTYAIIYVMKHHIIFRFYPLKYSSFFQVLLY